MNQTNQSEQQANLNDMQGIESVKIDLEKFEGVKTVIVGHEFLDVKNNFSKNPNGTTKVLKFYTEVLDTLITKDGEKIEIRATELINLIQNSKTGKWDYSKDEKSNAQKMMTKFKVAKLKDVIGKTCIVCVRNKKKKDDQGNEIIKQFLGIVY